MATTLKVDDTDARLEFGPAGAWSPGPTASWNKDGTYQVSTTGNARFYILFRGSFLPSLSDIPPIALDASLH